MYERIQLLANLLVKDGLKYAFGVSGSGPSLSLISELEERGVRYFPAAHEASAALMAGAVTGASGQLSASISIKGPGLANMLPGIVSNHLEGAAALSIAEAYGSDVPYYRRHKRLDHGALLSSVVKGIVSLDNLEHGLTELLQIARREAPGPVHLDLCGRGHSTEPNAGGASWDAARLHEGARREFLRCLENSERPILIVGALAARRGWRRRLETLRIPVFTTVSAKGILDESLAHSAGVFTGAGRELAPESHLFAEADLIVGVGLRNTEVLQPVPFNKPLIILDEVGHGLAEGFEADVLLIQDDADLSLNVFNELQNRSWDAAKIQDLLGRMQRDLLAVDWLPALCFDVLNQLEFAYALVLDTGSFCTIGEHLWLAGPDRYFMGSSNGRYMGTSIPSAIGLAVCRPGLPVFCAVGDGGMRMYPAEIKLAVQEELPICFILMADGLYGSVACVPQPKPMSSRAVTVFQPSWSKSVEGMGCEAYSAESRDSFAAIIQAWDRSQPLFVEATFSPEAYAAMTSRLR